MGFHGAAFSVHVLASQNAHDASRREGMDRYLVLGQVVEEKGRRKKKGGCLLSFLRLSVEEAG
jgi:hypothetical protein